MKFKATHISIDLDELVMIDGLILPLKVSIYSLWRV